MENEDLDRILKEAEVDKPAEKPEEKKLEEKQEEKVEEEKLEEKQEEKVEEEKPGEQEKKEEAKPTEKPEEEHDEKVEEDHGEQEKKEEKKLDFYVVGPDGTRFDQMPGESEDDVRERAKEYYDELRESDESENADVATPNLDNSDLEKDELVKAVDLKPAEDDPIDRDNEVMPKLDNDDVKEDGDKETKDINERVNWIKKADEKVHADALRNIRNGVDRSDELKKFDEISQKKLYDAVKNLKDAKADKREKLQELKDDRKQEKAKVKAQLKRGEITKDDAKKELGNIGSRLLNVVSFGKFGGGNIDKKYNGDKTEKKAELNANIHRAENAYRRTNDNFGEIARDRVQAGMRAEDAIKKDNSDGIQSKPKETQAKEPVTKEETQAKKPVTKEETQAKEPITECYSSYELRDALLSVGLEPTEDNIGRLLEELYKDPVSEDTLEINPEVANSDDKFEDGVAEPIGDDSTESVDTHEGNDASETADDLTAEVNDIMDSDPVKQTEKAPEDGNDEFEDIAESLNSILDMLKEEESVKMPEPPVDKKPEESRADLDNKDMKEDGDKEEVEVKPVEIKEAEDNASELSIADMVSIVTEAAYNIKSRGEKATYDAICEEAEKICDDPEHKEFNVDAVLNSEAGAEIGTCENDKDIAKADDLHEDAEEIKPEEAVKEVKAEAEEDKAASSEDVEPAPVLETDNYSSIKEACMLGEYYFNTDSYTIDTPEAKSNKLVEQISLLIAREHNDPLYNELLKEAVYTNRLHEAVTKKYKNEAVPKAEMITKKKELCESLSLDELNEDAELNEGAVGRWFTRMAVRMMTEKALNKCLNKAKEKAISSSKTPEERKAISDKVDEIMALPKKEKKQKLIELCKKAPEKDQDAAERKLKAVMSDSKAKSELTEEADGLIDVANKALDGAEVTLTARNAMAILNNNAIIIILSIVTGLLAAGLIAVIAYNLNKALKGNL